MARRPKAGDVWVTRLGDICAVVGVGPKGVDTHWDGSGDVWRIRTVAIFQECFRYVGRWS